MQNAPRGTKKDAAAGEKNNRDAPLKSAGAS